MMGALWGLVWTIWGRDMLVAARSPLLFLLFMVPLPGVVVISASFYLKLLAAKMATALLNMGAIPAIQTGSTIHLPGVSILIDDTCSGLRSLISLTALSVLWAMLMPASTKMWKKLVLVSATVPVALVSNMIRILALVLFAMNLGPEAAQGFLHYGSGLVVFGVAIAVLAWLSALLQRGH